MVRIIAGLYRGRRLEVPKSNSIRPTTDMVKEWIFSVLGCLEGGRVLDLYAGSGNLGLEALSRGAKETAFVDSSYRAIAAIEANVTALGCAGQADIIRQDAVRYLNGAEDASWNLILADPPYGCGNYSDIVGLSLEKLSTNGELMLEAPALAEREILRKPERKRKFGETTVYIFRNEK